MMLAHPALGADLNWRRAENRCSVGPYPLLNQLVDTHTETSHTKLVVYMQSKRRRKETAHSAGRTLADLPTGQRCVLDRLDLPEDIARRLMELGFLPGNEVIPGKRAPGWASIACASVSNRIGKPPPNASGSNARINWPVPDGGPSASR